MAIAVPVKTALTLLVVDWEKTFKVAVLGPIVEGVNVTSKLQLLPALSVNPQVTSDILKLLPSVPEKV